MGDTCYSHAGGRGDLQPGWKTDRCKRQQHFSKLAQRGYVRRHISSCHTDITIPYDELGSIVVVAKDGTETEIIRDGRFVLPGTEILNEPLN